ncbi:F-box domain-containing protein [Rhynchospora pubera]|uniref:F-box domain-containing protein n=1 Tax=Rhynchospora pubera TaxID=906938 RepID=A0AAV8CY50_9POAL|nr:F-box domain-containing protein [Rhynchospora pubera]
MEAKDKKKGKGKGKEREASDMVGKWEDLPPELFPLILRRLPDISDFIRSRAAFLLGFHFEFYSVALDRVYTVPAPVCADKVLFGHAGGYMLLCQFQVEDHDKPKKLSLVNPLTHTEVPLPDLHCWVKSWCHGKWISPSTFQISDDYVILKDHAKRLAICKPGDDSWHIFDPPIPKQQRLFYLKGMLFMVDRHTGITTVMDIATNAKLYVILPPKSAEPYQQNIPYFVESCAEILTVFPDSDPDSMFTIFRLELGNGVKSPYWVKIRSIGDRILFIDLHTGRGFCLRENDFGGFKGVSSSNLRDSTPAWHNIRESGTMYKGNCIYFIESRSKFHRFHPAPPAQCIVMYDIEKRQYFSINGPPFDRKSSVTWYMPTLHSGV